MHMVQEIAPAVSESTVRRIICTYNSTPMSMRRGYLHLEDGQNICKLLGSMLASLDRWPLKCSFQDFIVQTQEAQFQAINGIGTRHRNVIKN